MDEAAQCRSGLEGTLRSAHMLTSDPRCAAELLLNRMNGVLHAAVASNFGEGCQDSIGALYESIGHEKHGMIDRCEDMPLFFFARSFAVVLEEAVRQLQQLRQDTLSINSPDASSDVSMRRDAIKVKIVKKEEFKGQGSEMHVKKEGKKEEATEWMRPATPVAAASDEADAGEVPVVRVPLQQPAAAAADLPSRGEQRQTKPGMIFKKCFSPGDIKGRINICNIPHCVSDEEIRSLLRHFGPTRCFMITRTYDTSRNAQTVFQSNEAADAAVTALDYSKMGGGTVRVKRAEFRYKWKPRQDPVASESAAPRFGCYKETPAAATAADASAIGSDIPATVDSDDETEELRDNLSNSSFFSVD